MKKALTLVILMSTILLGTCSPIQTTYSCLSPERKPVNNSNFQLLWSRSGIAILPNPFDTPMQGITSKVFVVTGQDAEYGGSKILAFDTQSGNILWRRDVISPASIITSNSQLYTGLYDKIEVVDPQTGNLVKTIEVSKVGFIYNIFATEHNLFGFTKSGRWLIYNIGDATYNLSEPFLPYTPFLIENGIIYFSEAGAYKARDTETEFILWEYTLPETVYVHPLITDNVIIIVAEMGNIYGLDKRTGNLIWKVDAQVISNVSVDISHLYFLTNGGYLKVLDINSGQETEKLKLSPDSFELDSPPSGNIIGAYNLWVDSDNEILTVSFGDSCQLMAFKLNLP